MKLLNVGCGGQRPQDEHWYNTDNLREQLAIGTPERKNLDAEPRYFECNLMTQSLPFADEFFDGVLLQHVLEHFSCHDAVDVLLKCRRVLKPGGLLLASVPDAEYFLEVYNADTKERAVELFGEPIHDAGFEKFFDYALFRHDHKQVLCKASLMSLFVRSGFRNASRIDPSWDAAEFGLKRKDGPVLVEIKKQLSRRKFSIEMFAAK